MFGSRVSWLSWFRAYAECNPYSVGSGFVLVRGIQNGGICGSGFRIEVVGSDGAGRGGARWRCGKEDAR